MPTFVCSIALDTFEKTVGSGRLVLTDTELIVVFTKGWIDVKMAELKIFVGMADVSAGVPSRAVIDPKKMPRLFRTLRPPSKCPDVKCQLFSVSSLDLGKLLRRIS